MHGHHHTETLNFEGFTFYYNNSYQMDGYGGFDYKSGFSYMNQSTWTMPDGVGYTHHWCDTGYQNVAGAAKSTSLGWIYEYGLMESVNPHETFTLKSLLAAASWSSDAIWDINSYVENSGALILKGTDQIAVSFSKADRIRFGGKLAKDFTNIAAVGFEMVSSGSPGNTCTYGYAVQGVQLCLDNIRVRWNGRIPDGHGGLRNGTHAHHVIATAFAVVYQHGADSSHDPTESHAAKGHDSGGYHSELTSLDAALGHTNPGGGLTSQFALPQADHFGT